MNCPKCHSSFVGLIETDKNDQLSNKCGDCGNTWPIKGEKMDEITKLKAEIFDIMRQREDLQIQLQNKIKELKKLEGVN